MLLTSKRELLGSHRLLVHLLYAQASTMDVMPRGIIRLHSLRRTGRILGTDSRRVRTWLNYLEGLGYLESLTFSENKRMAQFRIRAPSNVI